MLWLGRARAKALYTRQVEQAFAYDSSGIDVLVVPTTPTHSAIEKVLADPLHKNSVLGRVFSLCQCKVLDLYSFRSTEKH